jgi:hypothetical protein
VYYKTLSLSVCFFEQNSPYVSARSNSVVFGSEKPQFSGAASFWIVVVVAPCGVANADLKVPVHGEGEVGKDTRCSGWRDYLEGFNWNTMKSIPIYY